MSRPLALLACTLLVLAPKLALAKESTPPSQYVDRSVVDVPMSIGNFTLVKGDYDPANVAYGVSTRWSAKGAPANLVLDVYIFPMGKGDEEKFVKDLADRVQSEVDAVAAQKTYSDVQPGPRTPFQVVRPTSAKGAKDAPDNTPFDPTPKQELALEAKPDADPVTTALAETKLFPNSHGIRQPFKLKREGVPTRSMAYVFHRHLFAFEVRSSVPEDEMDQAAFEALSDEAARWLVPQILVVNYGSCGTIEITTADLKAKKSDQEFAGSMIRGMRQVEEANCANSDGKKSPALPNTERFEIVYPAGTWQSG